MAEFKPFARGERERLPKRRPNGRQEVILHPKQGDSLRFYFEIGRYEDDRPGEVWLDVAKVGSALKAVYGVWAMTASKALQYGMPLKELGNTLRHVKEDPFSGFFFLTDDPEEEGKQCSSIWDAIAQVIELEVTDAP